MEQGRLQMVLVHAVLDGDDTEVHVGTRAGTLEDGELWRGREQRGRGRSED